MTPEAIRLLSLLNIKPEQILDGHARVNAIADTAPTEEMALRMLARLLAVESMPAE